jgi:hypothetical protein
MRIPSRPDSRKGAAVARVHVGAVRGCGVEVVYVREEYQA